MALSVAVFVGETKNWVDELVPRAKSFKIGRGDEEGIDISPVAYP